MAWHTGTWWSHTRSWQHWDGQSRWKRPFSGHGLTGSAGWKRWCTCRRPRWPHRRPPQQLWIWGRLPAPQAMCHCRRGQDRSLYHIKNDWWHLAHRKSAWMSERPAGKWPKSLPSRSWVPGEQREHCSWGSCTSGGSIWLSSGHRPWQTGENTQWSLEREERTTGGCRHWTRWSG